MPYNFQDATGYTFLNTPINTLDLSFNNASVGFNMIIPPIVTAFLNVSGIDNSGATLNIGPNASMVSIGNSSSITYLYGTSYLGNISTPRLCNALWNSEQVIQNNGGALNELHIFTCKYSGIYICSVTNALGNAPSSINLSYNNSTLELCGINLNNSNINLLSGALSIYMNSQDTLSFNPTNITNSPLYSISLTF